MDASDRKSLYDEDVYHEILDRIGSLTAQTERLWGSMTAAQMLAHCSEIVEVSNGKALENTPFIAKLFKGMIRKMVVGDRPYPKETKTHPQYEQHEERDFDVERERLLAALAEFKSQHGTKIIHPLFGELTVDEKGWAGYKHLDHHLSQFGV